MSTDNGVSRHVLLSIAVKQKAVVVRVPDLTESFEYAVQSISVRSSVIDCSAKVKNDEVT